MLVPETDAYAPVVRFHVPARERWIALVAAVVAAAVGAAAWFVWNVPVGARLVAITPLALAVLWFLVRSCCDDRVTIDIVTGTYTWRSGICRRTVGRRLMDAQPLHLVYDAKDEGGTADGLPTRIYSAWLSWKGERLPLARGWNDPRAREHLALLAGRLGATLLLADEALASGRTARASGSLFIWTGVLAIFAVMFWPVLSGRRPLRPVWASTLGAGPVLPREVGMFDAAMARYRGGDYRNAEKLFAESVSAGMNPAVGLNMMAYAQSGQKRLDDALRTAEKALSYAPRSGVVLDTVGEIHELRKEYDQAVDYYERALKQPDIAPAIETNAKLGRTLLALGRRKQGIDHLRVAARAPGDPYGQLAMSILTSMGEPLPYPVPLPQRRRNTNAIGREAH